MAQTEAEVIEIDDSPFRMGTPLRPVFCLKNRNEIKKFEEREECFILDFDPYDDRDVRKLCSATKDSDKADADLRVIAEKGQVACRDYPHSRHTCAKFPFATTPHESHCNMCYCYICDVSAPCENWFGGYVAHCHAFNNVGWDEKRKERKREERRTPHGSNTLRRHDEIAVQR